MLDENVFTTSGGPIGLSDGHDRESRLTCSHITVGGECHRMGGVGAFTADRGALHVDAHGQKA